MRDMLTSSHFWKVWLPPHVIAVALLWRYGLPASTLLMTFGFYCLISGLGVAVGLHRFFSHRSFKTSKAWEQAMLFFGLLACHGHALFWVALHRGVHHRYSDTEKDLHSPHAHSLWTAYQGYAFDKDIVNKVSLRSGIDFLREPTWQWQVTYYHSVLWGTWAFFALLWLIASPVPLLALTLAQVWAIHQEAAVNVLGHTGGIGTYRNYQTKDFSVNRPLLSLITWGQALHNNHHGDASNPDFGTKRWYEFDPSMLWIRAIRQ